MVAGHHVPIEPLLYPSRHCHVTGAPVNINCPGVLLLRALGKSSPFLLSENDPAMLM